MIFGLPGRNQYITLCAGGSFSLFEECTAFLGIVVLLSLLLMKLFSTSLFLRHSVGSILVNRSILVQRTQEQRAFRSPKELRVSSVGCPLHVRPSFYRGFYYLPLLISAFFLPVQSNCHLFFLKNGNKCLFFLNRRNKKGIAEETKL